MAIKMLVYRGDEKMISSGKINGMEVEMDRLDIGSCTKEKKGGGVWEIAYGKNGAIPTEEAFMSYVHYESGTGELPFINHQGLTMYIRDAKHAAICCKETEQVRKEEVLSGDIICVGPDDWYKFEFQSADGYVEALTFSSQPELNIKE